MHKKLINLESAKDEAHSLQSTYIIIKFILRALKQQGVNVDEDDTLRKIAVRKYPARISDSIRLLEKDTLKLLRECVNLIIESKEYIESIVSSHLPLGPTADPPAITSLSSHTEVTEFAASTKLSNNQHQMPVECPYCYGTHF